MSTIREQWIQQKLGKFGASDLYKLLTGGRRDMTADELAIEKANGGKRKTVDILFGDTAMTLINEKIAEILTGQCKEDVTGLRATEWGEMHEYDAVELYADQTGEAVTYYGGDNPKTFPYNDFSGASPDFMGTGFNGEVKCPFVSSNHIGYLMAARNKETAQAWLKENHLDYYVQCQFAMMACKVSKAVFISYDPRMLAVENRLAVIEIKPDEVMQSDIKLRLNAASEIIRTALATLSKPYTVLITPHADCTIVESIQ